MTYLYDRIAATRKGARALSSERLKYQVLKMLHRYLAVAGITQVELARRLGVRKSAVNQVFKGDGNMRISTLAEYLHEMGFEVSLQALPYGSQRADAVNEITRHWKQARSLARSVAAIPRNEDEIDVANVEWRSSSTVRSRGQQGTAISSAGGR